jgi:hypothetical protein
MPPAARVSDARVHWGKASVDSSVAPNNKYRILSNIVVRPPWIGAWIVAAFSVVAGK